MSFFKSKKSTRRGLKVPPTTMSRCSSSPSPKPTNSNISQKKTASSNKTLSYYQHLIEITLILNKSNTIKQRLENELHSELIYGWDISQSIDRTFYRLKPLSNYEQTIIVIENLNEVLLFSFDKFLDLNHKPNIHNYSFKLKWVYLTYSILVQSLTFQQKAMLFCKCSDRRNRTYKLIHSYKDCIVGKQAVDLLVNIQICKNRKAAVHLAQEFVDKGFLCHVENKHNFKDGNFWYKFDDENIQYNYDNFTRYSDDFKDDSISNMSMSIINEQQSNNTMISSDEEDNDFMLKDIRHSIAQIKKSETIPKLGTNHNAVIEWLLSLYSLNELQIMFNVILNSFIKSPNVSLMNSSTSCVYSHCSSTDENNNNTSDSLKLNHKLSDEEVFLTYHNKMHLTMCNKFKLHVKPFSMNNITEKQRKKLITAQSMTFDTWVKALQFIMCELWHIYESISRYIYLKLIRDLSMVEKAKILSIGIESKNRLKNLKKYRRCFVGSHAVTFLLNAQLAPNRKAAVRLGNMFYKKKWLTHVRNEYSFQDKDLFYRIVEDEVENRLDELRLYRKQQQSNHVNISLDIVLSPKTYHLINEDEDSDEILFDYHEHAKSIQYDSSVLDSILLSSDYFHSKKHTKSTSLDVDVESYFED